MLIDTTFRSTKWSSWYILPHI